MGEHDGGQFLPLHNVWVYGNLVGQGHQRDMNILIGVSIGGCIIAGMLAYFVMNG